MTTAMAVAEIRDIERQLDHLNFMVEVVDNKLGYFEDEVDDYFGTS